MVHVASKLSKNGPKLFKMVKKNPKLSKIFLWSDIVQNCYKYHLFFSKIGCNCFSKGSNMVQIHKMASVGLTADGVRAIRNNLKF